MLYPRSGAGLFWSLDFLGKPSLAWLTASVFACGDGLWLVSYLGVGTASGNGRCFGYSPQASPREEGWIAIPWVHTYPAIPSAENTECLPCSVMKTRSGTFSPSSWWKLWRKSVGPAFCSDIFPNRSNCHVNGCLSFPFFSWLPCFWHRLSRWWGTATSNTSFQRPAAFMCPSICCIGQSKCTHLELLLFRKLPQASLLSSSQSWWLKMQWKEWRCSLINIVAHLNLLSNFRYLSFK